MRDLLKPFGISPHFVSLVNDNFATLLVELEAQCAAAIMLETIAGVCRRLGLKTVCGKATRFLRGDWPPRFAPKAPR